MTVMRDAIDTTTLGWIKPELDETLRHAREEIEAFSQAPEDVERMRVCAGLLHQVHGTLRMIELYAPAMVAEEMERLAVALVHGSIDDRDDACAMLMRGAVQLPDYLERLQGGHRDIPIVLLPLLNELRATRGEPGLNESILFAPDLDRPLPQDLPVPEPRQPTLPGSGRPAPSPALGALREALAQWPEDGAPADPEQLATTVDELLSQVSVEPLRRMLWVASSVAGALRDGALQPTRALRAAFSGVEREARRALADTGFGSPEANAEPTRQLLYHVAHSQGGHPALDNLRRTFELDAELPSESEIEHARGSLSGRNRALLDTVSAAIKEDLLRVKDVLDLHLRTGQTGVDDLRPQVETLGRVSDTLGMMGLGVARGVVLQQRDAMHEIVAGQKPADEASLLDIAGALLYVDASLDEQVARLGLPDDRADADLMAAESRRVLEVVVREAIANFGDARQAFVAFVETGWDHAELAEIPRLLDEVGGALRILDLSLPADYLLGIRRYTEVELLDRKRVPNSRQLDTMADALASVEYYLEALREQRPSRERILDIARQSLERLGYWPVPAPRPEEEGESPVSFADRDGAAAALGMDLADGTGSPRQPAGGEVIAVPETGAADTPVPVLPEAGSGTAATATDADAEAVPLSAPAAPAVGGFEHSADIDDDIREVFLEELDEEVANLGGLLHGWREAPNDAEQLRPIRRIFHTLKGSGRLVGARALGEFSWKIENMLNRVLDGSRDASPAVVALVGQAHVVLPQFRAALQGEQGVAADLEAMEAVAERVAAGEEAHYHGPLEAAAAAAEAPPAAEPPAAAPAADAGAAGQAAAPRDVPAAVDAVLLEILAAEAGGHLATIAGWLEASREVPQPADDRLQRAIHTLNGALAMTEVPVITDITSPAEAYVRRLLGSGQPASAEGVAAIAAAADAVARTLAALESERPHVPLFEGLAARVEALRDSLPPVRPVMPVELEDEPEAGAAEPDAGLTAVDMSAHLDVATGAAGTAGEQPMEQPMERAPADAGANDAGDAAARAEVERLEAELLEAERLEAERLEGERLEAERVETGRLEAERLEAERLEAERLEAERLEGERLEAERVETERLEAERLEVERLEAERLERERAEHERLEAERLAEEEAEYARLEAEYAEADRLARERASAEAAAAQEHQEQGEPEEPEQPETAGIAPVKVRIQDPEQPLDLAELDPELVDIFVEEGKDLLDHSDGLLAGLRESPEDRELLVGLQRDLHTLKGGARMAGIMEVGELGHAMESLLEAVVDQRQELGADGVPLLESAFDRLHVMVSRVGDRRAIALPQALIEEFDARARGERPAAVSREVPAPAPAVSGPDRAGVEAADAPLASDIAADSDAPAAAQAPAVPAPAPAAVPITEPLSAIPTADTPGLAPLSPPVEPVAAPLDEDDIAVRAPQEQVRIRADLLDRLVNYAGEVAIYRARLEQQLGAFRGAIAEMAATNTRIRDQLRRLEMETEAQIVARYQREGDQREQSFDPLELDRFSDLQQLSRALAESAADQDSLQQTLDDLTRQYETLLLQQSRVSSELQEGLMRTRMVPFDNLLPRLRRVVRQASGELGKQVALKLDGTQGELDRNVLERMTAPLEHMLRNAVAHGIESPEQRRQAGKPEEGVVNIFVRREGSEVVIEVADDGGGLDRAAIRRRGEERGLLRAGAVLADAELDTLILEPGFSTATQVNRLAGRGVGMDVVASEVRQLGGALDIRSRPGSGTTFTLRLPQTLAVTQAVFVRVGETTFAVPIASVRGVARIPREQLLEAERSGRAASYDYGGDEYTVHDLGLLAGSAPVRGEGQLQMPLLLIRAGELHAAVTVDQVLGNREIVVKPVGPQVASIPGIFGATIMGDGRVVVILDVAPLVRRHAALPAAPAPAHGDGRRPVPLVMVVDDSVTMRKVTGRVLERHNLEVVTAKDGVDALERLAEQVPDLMLLDIEMPRMDGYELATQMKADPRLQEIPIIMITSRTGEKHRQRAIDLGVERYLGKPYQEPELMRNVLELLGTDRAHGR
ncbi:Hpt domain-containing protein [Lysobacter sp. GX 14042]|uniref:Hpt domain-containing protein n=1 Tax=Lysobacter sp. GX 14042 TaxID=2907155 RepID=UPI001F40B8F7|nr:Hpt domain-containing protein [Lysobacter sp. GX 14042]MCE7031109.1 Hpt domain-containing protein [Lysobacter sp. GX 14042]